MQSLAWLYVHVIILFISFSSLVARMLHVYVHTHVRVLVQFHVHSFQNVQIQAYLHSGKACSRQFLKPQVHVIISVIQFVNHFNISCINTSHSYSFMGELKLQSDSWKSWKELRELGEVCPQSFFVLAALTQNEPSILVRISCSTKML